MLQRQFQFAFKRRAIPGWLRRALHWAWQGAMMALLTRAALLGDQSPFAVAGFAAGLCARLNPLIMLAGCALGCRWGTLSWAAAAPLLGCVIVLGLWQIKRFAPESMVTRDSQGEAIFHAEDAVCAALAALGTLIPALALSRNLTYNILMALANGAIAMCCAPILTSALRIKAGRRHLLRDEQVSLILLCMCLLLGAKGAFGAAWARPAAGLMVLLAAYVGPGAGAAAGILFGAVLSFTGVDPFVGASLGLCGLMAGAVRALGRPASAAAFVLGNAVTLVYAMGYQLGTLHPLAALGAGALYCLLPQAPLDRLQSWLRPELPGHDPERLAMRQKKAAQKKLRALAGVFEELAAGCAQPTRLPNEQELIGKMRAKLCRGCEEYEACWNGSDGRAGRLLCQLLGDALLARPLEEGGQLPPEVNRLCRRGNLIPRKLGALLTDFDIQRRAAREQGGAKALMARQFYQASEILKAAGERAARPLGLNDAMAMQAAALLDREGLKTSEVLATDGDGLTITAVLEDRLWNRQTALRAARGLSKELGIPMQPSLIHSSLPGDKEIRFFQAPRYTATVGYVTRPLLEGGKSGDSHIAAGLTGGRVLLALSDGMGSGEAAARESATAVRLLRRFLSAEVERELALDSVNQMLLLIGGEDMFATIDLCVLDLCEGLAQFSKLGACASVVSRRGTCVRVEGGRLPLGILDRVTPVNQMVRVHPGDLIVMVTDGVADDAREGQLDWLEAQVRDFEDLPPQKLCEAILRAALERPEGAADDMTVLAAKIGRE